MNIKSEHLNSLKYKEVVKMTLPAYPNYAKVCRLAISGIVTTAGYSVDEIEDMFQAITAAWMLFELADTIDINVSILSKDCIELDFKANGTKNTDKTNYSLMELSIKYLINVFEAQINKKDGVIKGVCFYI
jgi:hypothetical protein